MDKTIEEIHAHIRRMREIDEEFKRIIKENDKIINPSEDAET